MLSGVEGCFRERLNKLILLDRAVLPFLLLRRDMKFSDLAAKLKEFELPKS